MRRLAILAVALILPLAASAQDMMIQPGKWQTSVTIIDMQMAGMPAGAGAAMKGKPTTVTTCVTPEQARAGPRAAMKTQAGCRFTRYAVSGGRIANEMVCSRPSGTMTVASQGSFTSTSYDMVGKATMTGKTAMKITTRTVGKRVGGC